MIGKGTVSALYDGGKSAAIKPYLGEVVTPKLTVHYSLRECLSVGMPVVYAVFEDSTGIIFARMDGEWNHKIWDGVEIVTGDTQITEGDAILNVGDVITQTVPSYNAHMHTVSGVETSEPK